ncbi:ABC transporter substrate-binding protein [Diaminobutyricibacter sp. McL0618]|uniref:ABC transporter substrate-binding protein n=1 Tax=Leifsonia sp. McL0618 TaxID=3415677 RepID=UPI003CEE1398
MGRRRGGFIATLAVAGLMLTACSATAPQSLEKTVAKPVVQAACKAGPVKGGSLTYARQLATVSLDPITARNGNGDIFADGLIYQGLVQYDPNGSSKIVPALAQSWTVSPDGLTYTFKLRANAKFSNGDPVTAEDVKFSLDRFGDPKINQVMGLLANGYGSSKIIDPSTFAITLTTPVPSFLDNIAIFPAFVVPKKLVEAQGDVFWAHPIGSGPFKVDSYTSGSNLKLSRNEDYWDAGKPYLDHVTFDFATDSNARLLSLVSGEAQIADGVTPSQITTVQGNKNLVLQSHDWPAWFGIFLNEKRPQLADVKVRQAIADAIDRDTINKQIFGGLGTIPNSVFAKLRYDSDTVASYKFDPTKAKALMKDSKFPNGFSIKLEYPSGFDYFNQMALAIQQNLSQIGIQVQLVKIDASTMADNMNAETYDMTFAYPPISSDVAVPDEYATFFGVPASNNGFHTSFNDPAVEALVKKFTTATSEADRAKEWPVIQQKLMDTQPLVNVLDYPLINAQAKNVCGATVNAMGVDMLQNTWLAPASK